MRGVGQTTNMIYNLPNERCTVVVHNSDLRNHLKKEIIRLRGKEFEKRVKIVSISSTEDCHRLLGLSNLIFFDHSFFSGVSEETAKKALNHSKNSAVIYHSKKGNLNEISSN